MAFSLRRLLDPLNITGGGKTPKAQESEAERAQLQFLQAQRDGFKKTGMPAQRERIAQTVGMRWDPSSGTYARDENANRAHFDGMHGNINFQGVESGAPIANVSQAYASRRPLYDPNSGQDNLGDIAQARDESYAATQTAGADYEDALTAAGNAAGIAHGAGMRAADANQRLAGQQAEQANFSAASRFARQTNRRGTAASALGAGMALSGRFGGSSVQDRLGNRRLHSGGR